MDKRFRKINDFDVVVKDFPGLENGAQGYEIGEEMAVFSGKGHSYTIVNMETGKMRRFVDEKGCLLIEDKDIAYTGFTKRVLYYFGRCSNFKGGYCAIQWTLTPDNRYFAVGSGFGAEDDKEENIYCIINRDLEIVVPFRSMIDVKFELQKLTGTNRITASEAPAAISPNNLDVQIISGSINGHDYVDLGLSVKWATCNVGASKPEDYGGYYSWGETVTKPCYNVEDYATCVEGINDIAGTSRDVACVKWGDKWHMPTFYNFKELLEGCEWIWTTRNGVSGCKVRSLKNSNSIFLPAAGFPAPISLANTGIWGYYWSSIPMGGAYSAYILCICSGSHDICGGIRHYGYTIRPVSE